MKWKRLPQNSVRIKRRFAWFPVYLNNGYTIWLEKYYSVERKECDYDGCCWQNVFTSQDKDEANIKIKCLNP